MTALLSLRANRRRALPGLLQTPEAMRTSRPARTGTARREMARAAAGSGEQDTHEHALNGETDAGQKAPVAQSAFKMRGQTSV
jgi:hypothetical protein